MVWNLLEKRIMENNENVTEPTPSAPKQMDFNKGIISEK